MQVRYGARTAATAIVARCAFAEQEEFVRTPRTSSRRNLRPDEELTSKNDTPPARHPGRGLSSGLQIAVLQYQNATRRVPHAIGQADRCEYIATLSRFKVLSPRHNRSHRRAHACADEARALTASFWSTGAVCLDVECSPAIAAKDWRAWRAVGIAALGAPALCYQPSAIALPSSRKPVSADEFRRTQKQVS
jgi:hypothetical protein